MKFEIINYLISAFLTLVGIFLLMIWFKITPTQEINIRISSTSNSILQKLSIQKVNIKGVFENFSKNNIVLEGLWNGFRGPSYDNINKENIKLKNTLDKSNLPILWSIKLGEGYAGPAVGNGLVYILDYDKNKQADTLRCFSFSDGTELWQRAYKISIKRNHGMSRTIPAITGKYVVTIGPKCQVMCVDALNGDFKWGIDLPSEYNTTVPLWYTGQCPVIDKNEAIIASAGKSLLIGVDCETGKVLWETPNNKNWQMSHSSIIPMTFYDRKMYVYCAIGGMVGVSADSKDKGKILWETSEWNHSVISPSPVQISENRILVTAGYGEGSMMFRVNKDINGFKIKKMYKIDKKVFACEQHTPIFYKNHLFSILPNDAGELNNQLVCMTTEGKIVWKSGRDNRFGFGPFIIADDKFYILNDDGVLTIAEASTKSYNQLSQVKVLSGRESWAPIAITNGRILLRDFEQLICLDIKEK